MKIYLVRHGDYDPNSPEKKLSEQGQRDIHKVGQVLRQANITVNEIWHSGKARAQQTAEILAEQINPQAKLVVQEFLNPDDSIAKFLSEFADRTDDLMVVSHLPFLEKLSSALLTGNEDNGTINFQQGAVLSLEKIANGWQVNWMVIPELI
jgi:phosphohistidine phosphatase